MKCLFDWDSYDIEIVGEAIDGVNAWDLINQVNPDLVITDIDILYMNGIELSKKIQVFFPNIKIIYISCFDEIDLVKSSLSVNSINYIFKPVNMMELQRIVTKIVSELNK